ncbi:hypothetical protein WKW77_24465 [Variovorax ureilyticus]|uniref:Uncharacterized protein n=1 Tax=Variovorax ureilyticus TaxID=1836198 RepID=A0ABU8VM75_9BURK
MKSIEKLSFAILILAISFSASGDQASKIDSGFCQRLAKHLVRKPGAPLPLSVETSQGEGRVIRYKSIDLDGDGKSDDLLQDCGSPSDGTCVLEVIVSSGSKYSFSTSPFALVKFENRYVVVVGDTYPTRSRSRSAYQLTAKEAELVCKKF